MGVDHVYSAYYFDAEKNQAESICYDEGRRSFDYNAVDKIFWAKQRELPKTIEVAMRYEHDFGGELFHQVNGHLAISHTSCENEFPAISVGENLFVFSQSIYTAVTAPLFFKQYESDWIEGRSFPRSICAGTLFEDAIFDNEDWVEVYKLYLKKLLPKRITPEYLEQVTSIAINFTPENVKLLWELLRGNWEEIIQK